MKIFVSVATCPFVGERGKAHKCAFQGRKDARSRHQRLFVENVGKTEGNRSKRMFQVRELYLRLRKVLAPLTFVSKDNNLIFRIVEIVLRKLTDCVTIFPFGFRHITEFHGLCNHASF